MRLRLLLTAFVAFFASTAIAAEQSAYDFSFTSIDGDPLPLSTYQGKTVLIVNTASRCGFTRQYGDLQSVWQTYRDRGLVVLGVPSNDFGNQEPGTEAEIKRFCEVNFNVDFPMTEKVTVKGAGAHPFYQWAAQTLGPQAVPGWNFHKYLIGPTGELVDWFASPVAPTSGAVTSAIEGQLDRAAGGS